MKDRLLFADICTQNEVIFISLNWSAVWGYHCVKLSVKYWQFYFCFKIIEENPEMCLKAVKLQYIGDITCQGKC